MIFMEFMITVLTVTFQIFSIISPIFQTWIFCARFSQINMNILHLRFQGVSAYEWKVPKYEHSSSELPRDESWI